MTLGKIPLEELPSSKRSWMTVWLLDLIMAQGVAMQCQGLTQNDTEVLLDEALQQVEELTQSKEQMEKELFTKVYFWFVSFIHGYPFSSP